MSNRSIQAAETNTRLMSLLSLWWQSTRIVTPNMKMEKPNHESKVWVLQWTVQRSSVPYKMHERPSATRVAFARDREAMRVNDQRRGNRNNGGALILIFNRRTAMCSKTSRWRFCLRIAAPQGIEFTVSGKVLDHSKDVVTSHLDHSWRCKTMRARQRQDGIENDVLGVYLSNKNGQNDLSTRDYIECQRFDGGSRGLKDGVASGL